MSIGDTDNIFISQKTSFLRAFSVEKCQTAPPSQISGYATDPLVNPSLPFGDTVAPSRVSRIFEWPLTPRTSLITILLVFNQCDRFENKVNGRK